MPRAHQREGSTGVKDVFASIVLRFTKCAVWNKANKACEHTCWPQACLASCERERTVALSCEVRENLEQQAFHDNDNTQTSWEHQHCVVSILNNVGNSSDNEYHNNMPSLVQMRCLFTYDEHDYQTIFPCNPHKICILIVSSS